MKGIVPQSYWDSIYTDRLLNLDPTDVPFKELFEQYLPTGGDCFEVGCYPGRFLAYLCRRFAYTANGIDLTPFVQDRLPAFLTQLGIRMGTIHCGDFLNLEVHNRFDVVCSFGFVEHFLNFEEVIIKHTQLVKPGGFLVLSCPNFRGLQHALHWAVDRENLNRHVLGAMSLRKWKLILERNKMEILHHGYYGTIGFWHENSCPNAIQRALIRFTNRLVTVVESRIHLPNRVTSPYMIIISRKPAEVLK